MAGIERAPGERDLTFVRLFAESSESAGLAEHVVVRRDSKVEFLAAKVRVKRQDAAEVTSLDVDEDLWLKVKIDGDTGWIHTAEDFSALGLQRSG